MKVSCLCLLAACAAAGVSIHAVAATPALPVALLGRWTVDTSRLPTPPAARPKHVLLAFTDADHGKLTLQVDIVGPDGTESHVEATYALDGSSVSFQGSIEADVGAMTSPAQNVLILALGKNGLPASTRIYTANADGHSMTETAVSTAGNGLPVIRTNHFERVSGQRSR